MRYQILSTLLISILPVLAQSTSSNQTKVPVTAIQGPKIVRLLALDGDGNVKPVLLVNATLVKNPDGTLTLTVPPAVPPTLSYMKRRQPVNTTFNTTSGQTQFDIPAEANLSTVAVYINGLLQDAPGDYAFLSGSRTVVLDTRFGNIRLDPTNSLFIEYQTN
jgi:hypothetical protein